MTAIFGLLLIVTTLAGRVRPWLTRAPAAYSALNRRTNPVPGGMFGSMLAIITAETPDFHGST